MVSLLIPHNLSSESAKSWGLYNLLHFPLSSTSYARGHKYVHRYFGDRVPDKAGNWCPRLSSGLLEGSERPKWRFQNKFAVKLLL